MVNLIVLWFVLNVVGLGLSLVATARAAGTARKFLGGAALLAHGTSLFFISDNLAVWIVPVVLMSLVLFVNALRLLASSYNQKQILSQVSRSSVDLIWALNGWFGLMLVIEWQRISNFAILQAITLLGAIVSTLLVARGLYRLNTWRYKVAKSNANDELLPTVTLAIPARNEDHALTNCLDSAIASTYPKLEILVLDDCSQDKTAQIIRSFAHSGVRFVQGEQPSNDWIGKNRAYSLLKQQASGDLLLFSGVDVEFQPDSISNIVQSLLADELDMVSILPSRNHVDFASTLLQPLRYLKTVLLSDRHRPAVLSTCWLIRTNILNQLGGFESVKNSVVPEAVFARRLNREHKYRFMISNRQLGITTRKRFSSQLETATRTLYPRLKRRLFNYLVWNLAVVWLALMPFLVLMVFGTDNAIGLAALVHVLGLLILNTALMALIHPLSWWLGLVQLPLAILMELGLLLWSVYKYEFSAVRWKGRNICVPVYLDKPT